MYHRAPRWGDYFQHFLTNFCSCGCNSGSQGLYAIDMFRCTWAHLASATSFFHDQLVDHACILERVCPCGGVYSECGWQLSSIWPPGCFHCLRLMICISTNGLLGFSSMQIPKNNPLFLQVDLASCQTYSCFTDGSSSWIHSLSVWACLSLSC